MKERLESKSIIELESSAADAFPFMLDYIYSIDKRLKVKEEHEVAMRYLARYFGIRPLFEEVSKMIKNGLVDYSEKWNGGKFALKCLSESTFYHDEKLFESLRNVCGEKMELLDEKSVLELPLDLFESIITSDNLCREKSVVSQMVCKYCEAHVDEISRDVFLRWTNEDVMSFVSSDVAFSLLKLSLSKCSVDVDKSFSEKGNNFQSRCIKSVSLAWEDELIQPLLEKAKKRNNGKKRKIVESSESGTEYEEECCVKHKDLPSCVQIELLEESLCAAKVKMDDEIQKKNEEIKKRDDELQSIKSELKKFRRLPASHNFGGKRITSESKDKKFKINKRDCTYVPTSNLYYGNVPPTSMPPMILGMNQRDGYVYKEMGSRVWPIFYYKGY